MTTTRHAPVDIADKTMCSRCGNEVLRIDEDCPAISDGEMYKRGNSPPTPESELVARLRARGEAARAYDNGYHAAAEKILSDIAALSSAPPGEKGK